MTQHHSPTGNATVLDRAGFFALFEQAIGVARPGSAPVLIVIDKPGLRGSGTAAFSALVADRLAHSLGDNGFIGLQPGGRFAVLIASDGAIAPQPMAQMLLTSLVAPIICKGTTLSPEAMLGMAQWDSDGLTAEELFVAADRMIYQVSEAAAAAALQPVTGVRFVTSPLRKHAGTRKIA